MILHYKTSCTKIYLHWQHSRFDDIFHLQQCPFCQNYYGCRYQLERQFMQCALYDYHIEFNPRPDPGIYLLRYKRKYLKYFPPNTFQYQHLSWQQSPLTDLQSLLNKLNLLLPQ